ncbi:hypothetical protein [Kribbella sp. NPDC048915]|uniref:hypothetical protein n=1 Tax=Kribbella sp. NPDC048915 TaxID=3155148 RepID=UPI0033E705C2
MWNRLGDGVAGPFWYVALAHEDDIGRTVTVITDGKLQAASRRRDPQVDVATNALLGLAPTAARAELPPLRLDDVSRLAAEVGAPDWQADELPVDGEERLLWAYRSGEYVAGWVDLGAVLVGFHGLHADQLIAAHHLVPVNNRVHSYALPRAR